jgi:putative FmdB family regulatory protein
MTRRAKRIELRSKEAWKLLCLGNLTREGKMPLYNYICQKCNAEFELLVRASDVPACPACGSEELQKQIARICGEIKSPGIAKSWRRAAAREGHLSNFGKD